MVTPDPVDMRLLSLIAEMGRAAVHEVAARMGMDPREVASRLVALSANGLPLVVGVECDPNGIRAALAAVAPPSYPVQGTPSGVYPPNAFPPGAYPPPSAGHAYPMGPPSGANAYQHQATPSGPYAHPAGTPSGAYPPPATPSGPYPVHGTPSGRYQGPPQPPSHPIPAQPAPPPDPVMTTWGPPQTSTWARGDQPGQAQVTHAAPVAQVQVQPARPAPRQPSARTGKVGGTLEAEGLEGEYLAIQLVEVVDPADFLFTAAGYRLQEGERSVVVHTEMVNRGTQAFNSLPDLYLVLIAKDGQTVSKAPVSLSSRPPHRIGVAPGETAGGHTVYVLPENLEISAVRWSARPDDLSRALTWTVEP
ncbi:AsnC family protein [Kibdelosporangium persicum]|uniref:AsnC family protein n=1 Tax=Kibdelosporangium persicum TaxID=2698649 RepID=UPI001566808D|nr:AsnC family protein [Kibdelosporangium persicum]